MDELFAPFLAAVGPREKISTAFYASRRCSIPFLSRTIREIHFIARSLISQRLSIRRFSSKQLFDPALNQYCLFFIDRQTFVLFDIRYAVGKIVATYRNRNNAFFPFFFISLVHSSTTIHIETYIYIYIFQPIQMNRCNELEKWNFYFTSPPSISVTVWPKRRIN